ncbi:MAG: hypothetical protein FWG10_04485 [Eubacteriaceae bacterium]|nr:hypothetical protein [Eubacteriaceae bacterium]
MIIFEKPGRGNTGRAIEITLQKAIETGYPILAASSTGASALLLCEEAVKAGAANPVVVVTHAFGFAEPGKNTITEEDREKIAGYGAKVVTSTHSLSGVERAMSAQFKGVYPAEIMSQTLKVICQGAKVVVEIGAMAMDAGALRPGEPVIAIAGTGRGYDTAIVMAPSHANRIFDTRIHEILCKPY